MARYCHRAESCTDPDERESVLDAASLGILKVGELNNQVEPMQHGFWNEFSTAYFLEMRHLRNLIGHTNNVVGKDFVPLGKGIVRDRYTAVERTLFLVAAGPVPDGFLRATIVLGELERCVQAKRSRLRTRSP